jgi:hypothetical protein
MNRVKKLRHAAFVLALMATTSAGVIPAIPKSAHAESAQDLAISPEAKTALERMNKSLKSAAFSFRSRTVRAYAGPNGELLHIEHGMKITVQHPDRLQVDAVGDDSSSKIFYDGKNLVVYQVTKKQYSSIPAPASIDEMIPFAESRMKIDFPLADLLSGNPGKSLLSGVTSGGEVGKATIDGTPCRHFFFIQSPDLELELWLEDNERALPRRVFVTYRSLPGHPTFLADLSDWDLSAHPSNDVFEFHPPAGVSRLETLSQATGMPAANKRIETP